MTLLTSRAMGGISRAPSDEELRLMTPPDAGRSRNGTIYYLLDGAKLSSDLNMHTIATWYYEQTPDEGGAYAQVPWSSSSEEFRDVYRRCLFVFFTCARAANPAARLVLFVNRPLAVSGQVSARLIEALTELDVDVHLVEYESRPDDSWPAAWRNQFFVLDALRQLASDSGTDDLIVLLDSDVCWTSALLADRFWSTLGARGCLTYDPGVPITELENGLDGAQLGHLYTSLTDEPSEPLSYLGGEIQACRGDMLRDLSDRADDLWRMCREQWLLGNPTVGEEAHLLTLAYRNLNVEPGGANEFIKRCWTQRLNYRNIDGTEVALALWHVPSEKRFGLRRLHHRIENMGTISWIEAQRDGDLQPELSRYLGIPTAGPKKDLRDIATRVHERLRRTGYS